MVSYNVSFLARFCLKFSDMNKNVVRTRTNKQTENHSVQSAIEKFLDGSVFLCLEV